MYLFERLIGVGTYFVITLAMTMYIRKSDRKNIGKKLFFVSVILSIMAYFYVPAESADLYRLIQAKNFYATMDFRSMLEVTKHSSTPIAELYLYFIGKMKIDGLLPMITCLIFYTNVFKIIKRASKRYEISSYNISLTFLFFMSSGILIEVISGIRTMLAFSIIASCIYKEFIEKKTIIHNIFWYFLAALIHQAALVLVIIRLIFVLFENKKNIFISFLNFIILFISIYIFYKYGNTYIDSMFDSTIYYMSREVYSYIWEYIIGIFQLAIIIIILIFYNRNCKFEMKKDGINDLYKFCKLITIIIILTCFEYSIFHRFVLLLSILMIPIVLKSLQNNITIQYNYKKYNLKNIIYWASLIILVLACARGNLSALKFFVF